MWKWHHDILTRHPAKLGKLLFYHQNIFIYMGENCYKWKNFTSHLISNLTSHLISNLTSHLISNLTSNYLLWEQCLFCRQEECVAMTESTASFVCSGRCPERTEENCWPGLFSATIHLRLIIHVLVSEWKITSWVVISLYWFMRVLVYNISILALGRLRTLLIEDWARLVERPIKLLLMYNWKFTPHPPQKYKDNLIIFIAIK